MQMAELERIDPADEAWADKVEHIRGAVLHHMFEEEGTWFLELKAKAPDQAVLTRRYAEEYGRYVFGVADGPAGANAEPRSFASAEGASQKREATPRVAGTDGRDGTDAAAAP